MKIEDASARTLRVDPVLVQGEEGFALEWVAPDERGEPRRTGVLLFSPLQLLVLVGLLVDALGRSGREWREGVPAQ